MMMKSNKLHLVMKAGVKNVMGTVSQFGFWYLVLSIELATLSFCFALPNSQHFYHVSLPTTILNTPVGFT